LMTFPNFFSSYKYWGFSTSGCCCSGNSQPGETFLTRQVPAGKMRRCGKAMQKWAWLVVVILLGIAAPIVIFSIPKFDYSIGLSSSVPRGAEASDALDSLEESFGSGAVYPIEIIAVRKANSTSTQENVSVFLTKSCQALKDAAKQINANLPDNLPPFTEKNFVGPMLLDGTCINTTEGLEDFFVWSNVYFNNSATIINIQYAIDPFSTEGQAWINDLRSKMQDSALSDLGEWYVYGSAPTQLDVGSKAVGSLPLMVTLMMTAIFIVVGVAFKSIIAPLRAVLCMLWMVGVVCGVAILTYQMGIFDFLNYTPLHSHGAMSFMTLCICIPFAVGLALDYDIFYTERVIEEWNHGANEAEAAICGLEETAVVISGAGVIMVFAFISMVICNIPLLNETGLILVLGILIDCFVTTKVIIPCAISILGKWNFWPRKPQAVSSQSLGLSLQ